MKSKIVGIMVATLMIAAGMTFLTNTGTADWDPGDGHKMHFPMTPDIEGWDVCATPYSNNTARIADDWQCSETGNITDIHFWGSWKNDTNSTIENFYIAIASHDKDNCMPEEIIWYRNFAQGEFTVRDYTPAVTGGWYAPRPPWGPEYLPNDHLHYYQYNFENIEEPFFHQIEGERYWLIIEVWLKDYYNFDYGWGWRTSNKTWGCNAVYQKSWGPDDWEKLYDPLGGEPAPPLDMAFVITGEPDDGTPPALEITKPTNAFYIFDTEIPIPLPFPVIIGGITISVDAHDNESGMDRVEYYIDNELMATDEEAPYEMTWNEAVSGRHTIKAMACDTCGNTATDERGVLIWNWT